MTRLAQTIFALLVCATFAAFFVTQRLKRAPLVVRQLTVADMFSPYHRAATIRFKLKRSDDVTVALIDRDGGTVRYLARDRRLPGGRALQFYWNGRTQRDRVAPDGKYRVRIGLRGQGRSVTLRRVITLDATPPHPIVTVDTPGRTGPAILPGAGRGVTFTFTEAALRPTISVYRSDGPRPTRVAMFPGTPGANTGRWDGTVAGRPAPPGTYFIAVSLVDRVGNRGSSPPLAPAARGKGPGRPGVTVRYLAVQAPLEPALGGQAVTFFVDARGARYSWQLVRVGGARPLARGVASGATLRVPAPGGPAGVALLQVTAGPRRVSVPFAVQPPSGTRSVLVVLPALSWQARNAVDDDGDGLPNTLDRGGPAALSRAFAGAGLPAGFTSAEGPLLAFLDRAGLRYDVTTDLALTRRRGPALERHRGVVLAGNPRWLTGELSQRLRRYVDGGGHVLTLGTDSLRRTVGISGDELVDPSGEQPDDAFGARPDPVVTRSVELLAFNDDRIGLFSGTDGLFSGFGRFELAASLGPRARLLAGAGEQEGRPVIAAYELGKGLVIRTGLPQWSARLGTGDPNVVAVTRRAWTLLSQ